METMNSAIEPLNLSQLFSLELGHAFLYFVGTQKSEILELLVELLELRNFCCLHIFKNGYRSLRLVVEF